nr:protein adenylyltransferase SelO family protein [uncultured Desulfobacter sp.]
MTLPKPSAQRSISTFNEVVRLADYSLMDTHQCPFGTGNGYGDGRAISVFEGVFKGQRWEMQIKGGGPTPYCRGADGRAGINAVTDQIRGGLHHFLPRIIPCTREYFSLEKKLL